MLEIAWKKLREDAKKPQKAHDTDAGFDLYAAEDKILYYRETAIIPTGYAVQQFPPEGWNSFGKVEDTSGNASKLEIKTAGGVIDVDYQGEIGVIVRNNNPDETIHIAKGKKVGQIIFHQIPLVKEAEWKEIETERGSNGFGSTGVANA